MLKKKTKYLLPKIWLKKDGLQWRIFFKHKRHQKISDIFLSCFYKKIVERIFWVEFISVLMVTHVPKIEEATFSCSLPKCVFVPTFFCSWFQKLETKFLEKIRQRGWRIFWFLSCHCLMGLGRLQVGLSKSGFNNKKSWIQKKLSWSKKWTLSWLMIYWVGMIIKCSEQLWGLTGLIWT